MALHPLDRLLPPDSPDRTPAGDADPRRSARRCLRDRVLSAELDRWALTLPPTQRTVLQLYFRDGLTQAAIASRLGYRSQSSVSELLRRAKANIQQRRDEELQRQLSVARRLLAEESSNGSKGEPS